MYFPIKEEEQEGHLVRARHAIALEAVEPKDYLRLLLVLEAAEHAYTAEGVREAKQALLLQTSAKVKDEVLPFLHSRE